MKPARCRRCQRPLWGEDPQAQRHQVVEVPPVKPVVTEYQLHRLRCPDCGGSTRAELPTGVPMGGFGPRVQAIAAPGHGSVPSVETHDPAGHDRSVWPAAQPRDSCELGGGDRSGGGGTSGRGAGLCADPAGRVSGPDRLARRHPVGLAMDGRHSVGHGFCGAAIAQRPGSAELLGEGLSGGDGSLEHLHLVSLLAAAALLGPHAARYRSHDRAWRALAGDR